MKVRVVREPELNADHRRLWSRLQQAEPMLASPCLTPGFAGLTAAVRDDVYVGVIEEGREVVGFFPFQRGAEAEGEPLARGITDFQGAVIARAARWTAPQLIAGCGLRKWCFEHLVSEQEPFVPYHRRTWPSPHVDLSAGFEAYLEERRRDSRLIRKLAAAGRRLERELGPLRFVAEVRDAAVLDRLLDWKWGMYPPREDFSWVRELLERLLLIRGEDFAGSLSALYAGDELVAAHMGMRSRRVLHYWFPSYDRRFARHSPGLLLLLHLARHARRLSIERIDLGLGDEPYKLRFMNGATRVAGGCVRL